MRINLICPYREKDIAKGLGALWDAAKKTWFIEDIEDLTPFMRWIPRERYLPGVQKTITLCEYLRLYYGTQTSLTRKAAQAFGVPYPLQAGWIDRHALNCIPLEHLASIKRKAVKQATRTAPVKPKAMPIANDRNSRSWAVTGPDLLTSCGCDALPWEDCECTESAAISAMHHILAGYTISQQSPSRMYARD